MVDIKAGDVLLFQGSGFISKAIRFLDGSEVNHAAIALDSTTLAEATGHGLDTAPISAGVENNVSTWVLRATSGDAVAAARRAAEYESTGVFYAYQQIILLAALCLTRRIPIKNRIFRKVVRHVLDSAADIVNGFVDKGADLMICSEYVYRCYRETGLDLLPGGLPDTASAEGDGVVLLDWLDTQPPPLAPMSTRATVIDHPLAEAERAEFEISALLATFFAETDPTIPVPQSTDAELTVTDDEITRAALQFGRATQRLMRQRDPQMVATMGLGIADLVHLLRGTLSTNANFVTPRDLFFTSTLKRVGNLP